MPYNHVLAKHRRAAAVILVLFLPREAHAAYIDPGTGTLILQLLAAGVLTAIFTLRDFWRWLRTYFGRVFHVRQVRDSSDDGPKL